MTSPVTLAESLVIPYRLEQLQVRQAFVDLIVDGDSTEFMPIDSETAQRAAELRSRYNLTLPDAFQIAASLTGRCEAFLTNDTTLKRVTELSILVLDELE